MPTQGQSWLAGWPNNGNGPNQGGNAVTKPGILLSLSRGHCWIHGTKCVALENCTPLVSRLWYAGWLPVWMTTVQAVWQQPKESSINYVTPRRGCLFPMCPPLIRADDEGQERFSRLANSLYMFYLCFNLNPIPIPIPNRKIMNMD